MMNAFRKTLAFIFQPIVSRYHRMLIRIHALEVIQTTLLKDPTWVEDPSKIFNGQIKRQSILLELHSLLGFSTIIETGTFIGDTTGWFAGILGGENVHTCERDPRFHHLARMRCAGMGIDFHLSDSRSFLRGLTPSSKGHDDVCFIYLDAHWEDDLPLAEELEIISGKWPRSVVMVDDFEVPGDSGYRYDDYGRGRSLTFRDFNPSFKRSGYHVYSPAVRSSDETGARTGMVVLTKDLGISRVIDGVASLVRRGQGK